jgi:hypothetical protein
MRKIILMLAVLFLGSVYGYCDENNQPVELTIESNKSIYTAGERIILTAIFKNPSDKEKIVLWNNETPEVISDKTKTLTVSTKTKSENVENLYIKSGQRLAREIVLNNDLLLGKYQIKLEYNFPQTISDFETNPSQEVWKDKLLSNSVAIEVIPGTESIQAPEPIKESKPSQINKARGQEMIQAVEPVETETPEQVEVKDSIEVNQAQNSIEDNGNVNINSISEPVETSDDMKTNEIHENVEPVEPVMNFR